MYVYTYMHYSLATKTQPVVCMYGRYRQKDNREERWIHRKKAFSRAYTRATRTQQGWVPWGSGEATESATNHQEESTKSHPPTHTHTHT